MSFFSRITNGWQLTKTSLRIINENRSLLLFPVLSTISLVAILATFFGGTFFLIGDSLEALLDENSIFTDVMGYVLIFTYYLINYTVVIFFNAALIHCAIKILNEEETSLKEGLNYALSKIGRIFTWAMISATVGLLLQILSNKGKVGEFVASFIGMAWSITTFFVVPILIYEEKGVVQSIKDSTSMVKEKWGESLTANVSLGIFSFIGILIAGLITYILFQIIGAYAIPIGITMVLIVSTVMTAAKTIFVAAIYNKVGGKPVRYFDEDVLDAAFILKH
jgi:hypothetical protein